MEISAEQLVSAGSLVVAIIAVVYSIKSYAAAKATTDIATSDHKQRNAPIKPYLIDGFSWRHDCTNRICFFAISLTNSSNSPASIVRAELHLHAYENEGNTSTIIIQPTELPLPNNADILTTKRPINLAAGESKSIWASYKIPNDATKKLNIDIYEIVFTSGGGSRTSIRQYIMKGIENAERDGLL